MEGKTISSFNKKPSFKLQLDKLGQEPTASLSIDTQNSS